jgi:hypothetical protein
VSKRQERIDLENQIFRSIIASQPPDPDHSLNKAETVRLLADALPFDIETEKQHRAHDVYKRHARNREVTAQLYFDDWLISVDENRRIEDYTGTRHVACAKATLTYLEADSDRAEERWKAATKDAAEKRAIVDHLVEWRDQQSPDRPQSELTLETCIRETGKWEPVPQDVAEPPRKGAHSVPSVPFVPSVRSKASEKHIA